MKPWTVFLLVGLLTTGEAQSAGKTPASPHTLTHVQVAPRDPRDYPAWGDLLPASGDVVVGTANLPSRDTLGASCNIRLSITAPGQTPRWMGLGWDVQLTANPPSWQSEIAVLITNVNGEGYILRPAVEMNTAGTGNYASEGVHPLCDFYNLPPIPLPDGRLYLEFYEVFEDIPNCGDDGRWDSGQLTFRFGSAPPFDGHTELGDAGSLPETAQATPTGALRAIRGVLFPEDVDIYAIYIAQPAQFRATTRCLTQFDTQLYLFDASGRGVAFNDDAPEGGLQSLLTAQCVSQPGLYYLAITAYGRSAAGCMGGAIWSPAPANQIRCPDGSERESRLGGWTGRHAVNAEYVIELQGVVGAQPAALSGCFPGQSWDEFANGGGDAGALPHTAQIVARSNATPCDTPVQVVTGVLQPNDVDMYLICIPNPSAFVASTIDATGWDTQLWLFRCDGTGIMHNDDHQTSIESRLDNSLNCITEPGIYLLAISGYGRTAVDSAGNPLWTTTDLRCAPSASRLAGWQGVSDESGGYRIALSGVAFAPAQGCPACPGDVNGDRLVDDADLLTVLFNFGQSGAGFPTDLNGDGVTDDADLLIVLFNFGAAC